MVFHCIYLKCDHIFFNRPAVACYCKRHTKHVVFGALITALIISFVVIFSRTIAGFFTVVFTMFMSNFITVAYARPGWRNPLLLGWVGMRGVVSLASALSIPLLVNDAPFPHRNLILFITFVVIIVTLVGQGLALPWVVRKIKPDGVPVNKTEEQQMIELDLALNKTALESFKCDHTEDIQNNVLLKYKYEFLKQKVELLYQSNDGDEARKKAAETIEHFKNVMMNVSEKERETLHSFRRDPDFDDDILRRIENRLDLEEERLEEDIE